MPFAPETFDVVLQRLAPFAPSGSPLGTNERRALALLEPGGCYLFAGWDIEVCTADDLLKYGYEAAEHHRWTYPGVMSDEEFLATELEHGRSADDARRSLTTRKREQKRQSGVEVTRREHAILGRKPRL